MLHSNNTMTGTWNKITVVITYLFLARGDVLENLHQFLRIYPISGKLSKGWCFNF